MKDIAVEVLNSADRGMRIAIERVFGEEEDAFKMALEAERSAREWEHTESENIT